MKTFNNFNNLSFFVMLLFTVVLFSTQGCSTDKIKVTNKVVAVPEDSLILDCTVHEPPTIGSYIDDTIKGTKPEDVIATLKAREKIMVAYASTLLKDSAICNQRFKTLRKWKADTIAGVNGVDTKK